MARLEVRNLSVRYATPEAALPALSDVSFDLDAGQLLGVVGESGSGKTTLLLSMLRLLPQPGKTTSGVVRLEGEDLRGLSPAAMRRRRGRDLAYVPQAAMSSLNPVLTVGAQIQESLLLHTDLAQAQIAPRVREVLTMVELEPRIAQRYPHELSGGMQQRAVIAMALAPRPRVVLADEPTSGLDVLVRTQILELLRRIVTELGLALLLVSHDLRLVSRWCDRALVMYAGRVVEEGPSTELLGRSLHPYAVALGRSLPSLRGERDRPRPIGGEVPDLARLPTGCPFHPRCPRAIEPCRTEVPEAVTVGGRRVACHLFSDDA